MTIIAWPSAIIPVSVEWGIKANTQVFASELNGSVQTVELPGARITCALEFAVMERIDAALMEAFLAKLRGQANRAEIPLYGRLAPRGLWAGAAAVNNEVGSPTLSQTGTTLEISGLTPFTTGKAGDWFNIGASGELKMLTDDFTADSGGRALISFQPPIRSAPAHGTLLITTNPVLPKAILTDPHARWRIKPSGTINDGHTQFAAEFVEVFE